MSRTIISTKHFKQSKYKGWKGMIVQNGIKFPDSVLKTPY